MFENPFLVSHQEIKWKNKKPFSKVFNDRYFQDSALEEIENVFIEPNGLREKFKSRKFTLVGELGFGLGISFLYTLKVFKEHNKKSLNYLDFVSVEKFLPTVKQIRKAASLFPELEEISQIFLKHYHPIHNGIIKIHLPECNAALTIINADIQEAFKLIQHNIGKFDAWYLDGFDPKQNPEMWTSQVIKNINKYSKNYATFGTYTSSGLLKKSLNDNQIDYQKVDGFKKRHKLVGSLNTNEDTSNTPLPKKIAVIGSGIAAAGVVHALAKLRISCDVFEKNSHLHTGASGNHAAAMYPKFQFNNSAMNRFLVQSYFFAYQQMLQFSESFYPSKARFFGMNERTAKWIERVSANDSFPLFKEVAQNSASIQGGVLAQTDFLKGAYLEPRKLTERIFKNSPSKIHFNHDLISIKHNSNLATLSFANGKSYEYDAVILAIGSGLQQWIEGLQVSKGHIIGIPKKYVRKISQPIHHQGYILPPLNDYIWMGSTYEHEYRDLEISSKQIYKILNAQKMFLKSDEIPDEEILVRASERVSRSNKFPIAAKISQNHCLYAVGALGSRGFSSSFLCGEVVANQIRGGFIPVDDEVLENLEV